MSIASFKPKGFLRINYFFSLDGVELGSIRNTGFWKNSFVFTIENKRWEFIRKSFKSYLLINSLHNDNIQTKYTFDWKGKGKVDFNGNLYFLEFDSVWKKNYYWKNDKGEKMISLIPSRIFSSEIKIEWPTDNKKKDEYFILSFILFETIITNRRIIATLS